MYSLYYNRPQLYFFQCNRKRNQCSFKTHLTESSIYLKTDDIVKKQIKLWNEGRWTWVEKMVQVVRMPAALYITNVHFSSIKYIVRDIRKNSSNICIKPLENCKTIFTVLSFPDFFFQMYTILKSTFSFLNTNCKGLNAGCLMCMIQTLFISIISAHPSNKIGKTVNT